MATKYITESTPLTKQQSRAVFCVPTIKHPADVDDAQLNLKSPSSFSLGDKLTSFSPLLEEVFKHLDYISLSTAAEVRSEWDFAAKRELKKRNFASWISVAKKTNRCCLLTRSTDFNYGTASLAILTICPKVKLEHYACLHTLDKGCLRMPVAEYLIKEIVYPNTNYCVLSCRGLSQDVEDQRGCYFQGLILPTIPNIRVTMFHVKNIKTFSTDKVMGASERPLCILMFTTTYNCDSRKLLVHLLKGADAASVALGGGVVRSSKTFFPEPDKDRYFPKGSIFCITFLKDDRDNAEFNAHSVVLHCDSPDTEDPAKFEQMLIQFKNRSVLRENGAIFRFCCFAKKGGSETPLIRKHFLRYHCMSTELDGEIGWNTAEMMDICTYTDDYDEEDNEEVPTKKLKSLPRVDHGYTTILVFITWGKKI